MYWYEGHVIVVFEHILLTCVYIYIYIAWLDINVFNPNICFVIFLWLKYMLHALVDMLKLSNVLECTKVYYECLLNKQGWGIRDIHSL